jgi:hypothetical protein
MEKADHTDDFLKAILRANGLDDEMALSKAAEVLATETTSLVARFIRNSGCPPSAITICTEIRNGTYRIWIEPKMLLREPLRLKEEAAQPGYTLAQDP